MHQSALYYAENFFTAYAIHVDDDDNNKLIDIGAQNVNGSIKDVCPPQINYIGVDFVQGKGVDVILDDPYSLPFADNSLDFVVCSSCFEHSQFFWLVFLEVMRVLKPTGLFYLNAPSNGFFHRYPVDCWRFYPDAGKAMVSWAQRNGYVPELLESFIGDRSHGRVTDGGMWNDFVAVFVKDKQHAQQYQKRIINQIDKYHSGYNSQTGTDCNINLLGPDFELIDFLEKQNLHLVDQNAMLNTSLAHLNGYIASLDLEKETVANLNKLVAHLEVKAMQLKELQEHCSILEQNIQESEKVKNELQEVLSSKEKTLLAIDTSKEDAWRIVDEMRQSRSWIMTKPLRDIGAKLRAITDPQPHRGPISLLLIAIIVFPITFLYYRNLNTWFKALKTGKPFFSAVVLFPEVSRQRIAKLPNPFRKILALLFRIGLSIHRNGGLLPAFRKFYRVIRFGVQDQSSNNQILNSISAPFDVKKILVMDYRIPMADVSAGERATVGILQDLCELGFDVYFLPNNMLSTTKYKLELEKYGVKVVTNEDGFHSAGQYIREFGSSFAAFYLIRVDVAESVLSVIRQVAPSAKVIFHAPDLYFLREAREAQILNTSQAYAKAEITQKREISMMKACDHVVVVSDAERPILQELLPQQNITVFPALYTPITADIKPYQARKHIFFLGGFAHTPNIDAVQWFVANVWPLIHAQLPEMEFHIIGAEAPDSIKRLSNVSGVKFIGYVDDLKPILDSFVLGVAPLRYGAGIKGKVAMTMGAGVPCICSTIASEGMGIIHNIHSLIADEPSAFAEAVLTVYNNEIIWCKFSTAAQALIKRNFSSESNRSVLIETLDQAKVLPLDLFRKYCTNIPPRVIPKSSGQIDVSIIIPVYNQWSLTVGCINSILETTANSKVTYELILADDGSTDDTVNASEIYKGLTVVKTPKNLGFLRNCNYAATKANGHYILLLNNDTIVLPNWLDSLFNIANLDSSIAIVGSKMLYPDGKIQEAGGLFCNNGAAHNAGRGFDRHTPFFNILRQTDYISGCSILIRRDFWDKNGGFDESYQNAYCEDADLAMTARKQGYKVVYQPKSEVIHLEHQSYNAVADAKRLTLQQNNTAIFLQKWQSQLVDAYPQHTPIHLMMSHAEHTKLQARDAKNLNVLYFSPFPSHPTSHGNRATIYQYARRFQSMGHKVHFVLLKNSDQYTAKDVEDMSAAWDTFDEIPYGDSMGIDPTGIPFDAWYQEGLGECIRLLCEKYSIDIVFCSYVFQSKLLEYVPDYMMKIIDTHDKMGNRYEMLRANGQPLEFFSCTPEEEGQYLQRADIVIARRQEEADYFNAVSNSNTAIVVPHVEPPAFLTKTFDGVHNIGIVASANRINLALVLEFLQTVDSFIGDKHCPFIIHIAGEVKNMVADLSKKDAAVFGREWVKMHGFVPDIATFYNNMDLIVSPVTMGTGINVKTVQAMAYGMPLLTTTCGIKGIETVDQAHNHEQLGTLVEHLFKLVNMPKEELERLALLSRQRYEQFYNASIGAMQVIFSHAKLHHKE